MKKKILTMITTICMLAAFVTGCGGNGSTADGNSTADGSITDAKETNADGSFGITLAVAAELSSMDSNIITSGESMVVCNQTMEGLYKYNEKGELVPGMAESVDISEDGLTYTFTIRDAKWSNGTSVTAHDFEYGWKRLANPETGATYAFMLMTAGVKNAEEVCYGGGDLDSLGCHAEDDKTFVVELDRPVAYFPSLMTGTYFFPINQEYCESQGDQYGLSKENVIACGPYVLTQWQPGEMKSVLTKNESYYDASNVKVDSITYNVITDTQQAIMAWENGNIDQISITGDTAVMYKDDPAFDALQQAMLWYIAVNEEVSGLENKNLRMALALAYDKTSICENILKNGSIPANFVIPENFALDHNNVYFRDAANATYLESDKTLALEYYNKACEELGQNTFTFELLYDDAEDTKNIAQFIQSEIQSALPGVTITLQVQPKNQRVEAMNNYQFELGLTRWGADYQDATTYLDMWTTGNSYNYGSYSNPEYDALMERVNGEYATDLDARLDAMIEAESIILNDAGVLPVYQSTATYLTNTDLEVPTTPSNMYLWRYATKKSAQ